jgi:hypothetical protein
MAMCLSAGYFLQVSTCARLKFAFKAMGFGRGRGPSGEALLDVARSSLRPGDWLALSLLAAGLFVLLVIEIRGRRVSAALRAALSSRSGSWLFLGFVAAVAVRPYFDAGIPHAFDGKLHFSKLLAVADLLGEGEWPSWTFRWYLGMPLLRFYGPSFYIPAAAGTLLGLSADASLKVFLVLALLVSALGVHRFAGSITGSRSAATVAAAAWLLALPPLHALLDLGRLPEASLYVTFPWLLFTVERFAASRSVRWAALAGALLAVSLLAHPKLALLSAAVAMAYGVVRLIGSPVHRRRPVPALLFAAGSGATALALSAFWLLPALGEIGAIQGGSGLGGELGLLVPDGFHPDALFRLLDRSNLHKSLASVSYVGWTVLLLAALGLWSLFKASRDRAVPLLVAIVLCLFYIAGSYFQSRCVAHLTLLLSVTAGAAFAETSVLRRFRVPALALLLLDLVPLGLVSPFRPDLDPLLADMRAFAPQIAGRKAVVVSLRSGKPELSQWTGWDDSGVAVLGGPFREAATGVYSFGMAALGRVRDDLEGPGSLSRPTVDALRLLGVAAVVFEDGTGLRPPPVKPGPGYRISAEPPAVIVDGEAPAIFATSLEPAAGLLPADLRPLDDLPARTAAHDGWSQALARVVAGFALDSAQPRAARILTRGDESLGGPRGSAETPRFFGISANHLEVAFSAWTPGPGFLLLPFADYPGVMVSVDGAVRETVTTVLGTLAVPVEAGEHRVAIRGPRGLGAGRSVWLTVVAMVLCGGVLLLPRGTRRSIC